MKSYPLTNALNRAFPKKKVRSKDIGYPLGKDRYGYNFVPRLQVASDFSTVKHSFDCNFSSGKELDAFVAEIKKQYGAAAALKIKTDTRAWGTFWRPTTQAERDAIEAHIQRLKDQKAKEIALEKKDIADEEARKAARDLSSNDSAVSLAAALRVLKANGLTVVTVDLKAQTGRQAPVRRHLHRRQRRPLRGTTRGSRMGSPLPSS